MATAYVPARALGMRRALLPRAWPVYGLMFGLPLWWLLGLSSLIWPVFAVPMALALWRKTRVTAPRGFGLWLLFIGWVIASGTQLDEFDRLISFGYRLSLYISAAVLLLYVYNSDERWLPRRRIPQMAAAMWITIVAGGFAALVWPTMSATSLTEMLLPSSLSSHPFMYDLVHLRLAQYSGILEYPVPRPTAPFAYTNEWGSNLAILTPMYVLWLTQVRRAGVRMAGFALLLLSLVPVVQSLNRGLWLSLGATTAYAIVRLVLQARGRPLAILAAGGVLATGVFLVSPLPGVVADRLATPHSNEGRRSIYEGAAQGAAQSPLLGFGTTRPQDEGVDDGGRQVGTHGQLWLVLFSHGVPGLMLFLSWLGVLLWRTRSADLSDRFYVHLSVVTAVVQLPYYGLIPAQIHVLMLLGAFALRPRRREAGRQGIGAVS